MSRIDVTLGITNIASSNRVPLKSYTFVKHPSWTANNIVDSNIGLIKLPSRVTFTSRLNFMEFVKFTKLTFAFYQVKSNQSIYHKVATHRIMLMKWFTWLDGDLLSA